jgi:hypothetical protein
VIRAVVVAIVVASSLAAPGASSAGGLNGAARVPGRLAGRTVVSRGVSGISRTAGVGRASSAPARHRRPFVTLPRSRLTTAARVPDPVGSRGGRQSAVVAGSSARPGVIGRYGDAAMGFVRRNMGPLAAAAVLAAFVNDPRPFLAGAGRLVAGAGRSAAGLSPTPGVVAARWRGWAGPALVALILAGVLRHRLIPGSGRVRRHP